MKLLTSLVILSTLSSGCATCREHPVACTMIGTLVVGSIAATIASQHEHTSSTVDPCGPNAPNRSNGIIGSCVGRN